MSTIFVHFTDNYNIQNLNHCTAKFWILIDVRDTIPFICVLKITRFMLHFGMLDSNIILLTPYQMQLCAKTHNFKNTKHTPEHVTTDVNNCFTSITSTSHFPSELNKSMSCSPGLVLHFSERAKCLQSLSPGESSRRRTIRESLFTGARL